MSRHAESLFNFTFSQEPAPRSQSRMITTKAGGNDVVDALEFIRRGSELIVIENNDSQNWEKLHLTSDRTSIVGGGQVVLTLAAVEAVAMASEITVSHALEILELPHVRPEGLESLLFSVTLLGGHTMIFIADSPRSCYIWMRAVQILTESTRDMSMIPLMVSNRLRSGTLVHFQDDGSDDEEETVDDCKTRTDEIELVECLSKKHNVRIPFVLSEEWRYFEREIDSLHGFVDSYCVFDTTPNLALMGDVLRLKNRLNDLESRLQDKTKRGESFRGWGAWPRIHEMWWLLHSDIAVTHMKSTELREAVGLKY